MIWLWFVYKLIFCQYWCWIVLALVQDQSLTLGGWGWLILSTGQFSVISPLWISTLQALKPSSQDLLSALHRFSDQWKLGEVLVLVRELRSSEPKTDAKCGQVLIFLCVSDLFQQVAINSGINIVSRALMASRWDAATWCASTVTGTAPNVNIRWVWLRTNCRCSWKYMEILSPLVVVSATSL